MNAAFLWAWNRIYCLLRVKWMEERYHVWSSIPQQPWILTLRYDGLAQLWLNPAEKPQFFWWLTNNVSTVCTKNVSAIRSNKILCFCTSPTKLMKRFGIGQAGEQSPHYCKRAIKIHKGLMKLQTCTGLSRDSKIWFSETLSQLTLNPAPRGSGGQNPRHRNVGGSCT